MIFICSFTCVYAKKYIYFLEFSVVKNNKLTKKEKNPVTSKNHFMDGETLSMKTHTYKTALTMFLTDFLQ